MNLEEYKTASSRTFAYRKNPLNEYTTDLLHCSIGICTEAGELVEAFYEKDLVNKGEEIADQMWYVSNLARMLNLDINIFNHDKDCAKKIISQKILIDLSYNYSSELLDIFKKHIYYGKELDLKDIERKLITIVSNLNNLVDILDLEMEKLLENNIEKLKIRFPDKFSQENALNRDLDSERKALEK